MSSARILVVEDDEGIRTGLVTKLELEGHTVEVAEDGRAAQKRIEEWSPDLVLLDLMLPEVDGIAVLRWLRRRDRDLPVLILSARGREDQKVAGLRAGADDYLAKPFGLDELSARVHALLRRALPAPDTIEVGGLTIDPHAERVCRGDEEIELSPTEWRLLSFFLQHPRAPIPRERVHGAVWNDPHGSDVRTVDYHVMNLRRKIESDPSTPELLITRIGRGYEWTGGVAD